MSDEDFKVRVSKLSILDTLAKRYSKAHEDLYLFGNKKIFLKLEFYDMLENYYHEVMGQVSIHVLNI
jgi:hypothetical protein